uniref:Eukaryotic translation initiation factor 3 subunit E n=1 Tax=Globodera pallida TaxID=36090 RepID=A0A183BIU8_GLOPA
MAEYDLIKRLIPFFDLHLVIPLLEYIEQRKIYDEESFKKVHLAVLQKTNMIDSLIEGWGKDEGLLEQFQMKKQQVLEERERLKAACNPAIEILDRDDVKEMTESTTRDREGNNKVLEYIDQRYGFKMEMLDSLYKYGKFLYECGNYLAASTYLDFYRNLIPQYDPNYLNAQYGKLASEILLQSWDHAKDDLNRLRAYVDSEPFVSELELLQHRAWILHWSLYIYFNCPKGRDEILCPHLLRYVAVSVITSKNKQKASLKDLVKTIEAERCNYQDPVTEFLSCLYIDFDFDAAQTKLRECESVLSNDFFLVGCLDDFRESARLLIFEMFCRIHQCIGLEMLANRLNMDKTDAERWIVNLIRTYRIEGAKIDSQSGQVVMGAKPISIHEQVMENTKRMTFRSQQVALQLEKLRVDSRKGGTWKRGEREIM